MKRTLIALVLAVATSGLGAGVAAQQSGQARSVLGPADARGQGGAHLPERDVVRSRVTSVQLDAMRIAVGAGAPIALPLFADASFTAQIDRTEQLGIGRYVWTGHLAGVEDGEVTFAVTDGVMAGQITLPGAQYRLHVTADGAYAVEQVNTGALPREMPPLEPEIFEADAAVDPTAPADSASQLDVMVVYTPAARAAAGGVSAMNALVDLAVSNANTSYANSGVTQRLRLVYRGEIAYTENTTDMSLDLVRLRNASDGYIDAVHTLRNTYAADFVSLWTTGTDSCGLGYVMTTVSTAFAPNAFNITAWNCAAGNLSFAHELGHNMGLQHDFASSGGGTGAYSYAFGYQDPGFFRTVMAYDCAGAACPRVTQFSTPTRTYGGRPTGVLNASENARALNNTAPTTANFRIAAPVCTTSIAPAAVSVAFGAATGTVALTAQAGCAWTAGSTAAFLSITSATSGTGNATVSYSVVANPTTSPRSGTLMIGGQTFTVTQAGAPCVYSLAPTSVSASFGAGTGTVALTAQAGCAWTAGSNAGFLSITSATSGTGSATVSYSIAANPATSIRGGTLTIGGQTFTVTQAGHPARRPPVDFNGDGIADIAVYRPEIGRWFVNGGATTDFGIAGDLPVPGDYNGDGTTELAVFRPANGTWYINGGATIVWGAPGDIPVPADYDGNGTTDIAVFRPSAGMFYVRDGISIAFGAAGDLPVPGDYNGDGAAEIAVFRPANGTWYINGGATIVWGAAADIPVPADYDGNGTTDIAVFRPSIGGWAVKDIYTATWGAVSNGDIPVPLDRNGDGVVELGIFRRNTGTWYFKNHATDAIETVVLGRSGDIPLGRPMPPVQPKSGDFDGDRKADLTVFRPSTAEWVSLRSASGMTDYTLVNWGLSTDTPVARDYDGDNKTDPAIYRPSTGDWYLRSSASGFTTYETYNLGLTGAPVPVPGDFDGDGRADVAVFRASTGAWTIRFSSNAAIVSIDFGLAGDLPVVADYDGDGRADPAVFRPSTGRWYVLNRILGTYTTSDWGLTGDAPAAADFDGDGRADLAVFRPALGRWFIRSSIDGAYTIADWGLTGDTLVPADYDGDGKADIAVFRPSTGMWYVRGLFNRSWGLAGDVAALR